jgi:hypothetical protein
MLVGAGLRLHAALAGTANADAAAYARLARDMSWVRPWSASFREPGWIAFVKATVGPFGYTGTNMVRLSFVLSVAALALAAFVFLDLFRPWIAVAGVAAVAVSRQLVTDAGLGGREPVSLIVCLAAIWLAYQRPAWLPVLAAVTLAFRWEMGLALFAIVAAMGAARIIPARSLALGAASALVLMGPFLWANQRAYGDALFHSHIHATFYRNVETHGNRSGVLPPPQRITPALPAPNYQRPLSSFTDYVLHTVGARETVRREVLTMTEVPSGALDLGRLPALCGLALFSGAAAGVWLRRDRVAFVAASLVLLTLAGYGPMEPFYDRRLTGHVLVPLVALLAFAVCAVLDAPHRRLRFGQSAARAPT